ncbi:hypothetical protein KIPB_014567, partial [Kipferlia bialata]
RRHVDVTSHKPCRAAGNLPFPVVEAKVRIRTLVEGGVASLSLSPDDFSLSLSLS